MAKKRNEIPRLFVRKGASVKEIYAQVRKQFTAADLQKYTVDEPIVPMEQVLSVPKSFRQPERSTSGCVTIPTNLASHFITCPTCRCTCVRA